MSKDYWADKNQDRWSRKMNSTDNHNGYWVAYGHLFKILYSYHRLIGRVEDKEKVRLCSRILLERYMNPLNDDDAPLGWHLNADHARRASMSYPVIASHSCRKLRN